MDDLISRQAAIKTLEKGLPSEPLKSKYTEGITVGFGLAITWIEQLPAVQSERKKGRWTDNNACPFCGFQPWYERDIHTLSFCPNCGADMRGEENETD